MTESQNIAGLFGPTVEQIQAQQMAADEAAAFNVAKLDPNQALAFYGARNGATLGRGLNALGVSSGITQEDPAVSDARVMQNVIQDVRQSGVDVNDPAKFYRQVSDKLAAAGKTGQAMMLSMKAGEYEFMTRKREAEVGKLNAEAMAKLREKESNIRTLQREAEAALKSGDLDRSAQLEAQIAKLNQPDIKLTESEEGAGVTKIDGREVPQVRKVLLDDKGKKIWEGTPYAKTGGQTVNLNNMPPQDDAGTKLLATVAERQAIEFNKSFDAANQVRAPINDMKGLIKDPKLIQGSLPEIRLEVVRALNTAGFGDKELEKLQTDSDLFDAYARNVILPKMRMLGGSDSNEELKKVEQSYANRKMDIAAIRRLVNAAEKDITRLDNINAAYNRGLSEGRNPIAFNWANGEWRNIPSLPAYGVTPPGTRPQPSGMGGTPAPGQAPEPVAPPKRVVGTADISRYREAMKAAGTDVSKFTDAQIQKMLEGLR